MTPSPRPPAPVPCPECVRLGRIDASDGLYKTHEHMQAAKFFPCGICHGAGIVAPAPVPTQTEALIQRMLRHHGAVQCYELRCGRVRTCRELQPNAPLWCSACVDRAAASALLAAETRERELSAAAQDGRMGHVRLDECADASETKGKPLYDRISAKIQKLVDESAKHRQSAAEYRAQRIVLDKELVKRAEQAEASATALRQALTALRNEMQQFVGSCRSIAADPLTPLDHVRAHGAAAGRVGGFIAKLDAALRPDAPFPVSPGDHVVGGHNAPSDDKQTAATPEGNQRGHEADAAHLSALPSEVDSSANRSRAERGHDPNLPSLSSGLVANAPVPSVVTAPRLMSDAPCDQCGYNGEGYYQPAKHPCARGHHIAAEARIRQSFPPPAQETAPAAQGALDASWIRAVAYPTANTILRGDRSAHAVVDALVDFARLIEEVVRYEYASLPPASSETRTPLPAEPPPLPKDVQILPYERLDDEALMSAVRLYAGEHVLCLRPFGWHLDGKHIPNAAEHFSREGVCEDHGWTVVCDYGPYVAIVLETRTERGK